MQRFRKLQDFFALSLLSGAVLVLGACASNDVKKSDFDRERELRLAAEGQVRELRQALGEGTPEEARKARTAQLNDAEQSLTGARDAIAMQPESPETAAARAAVMAAEEAREAVQAVVEAPTDAARATSARTALESAQGSLASAQAASQSAAVRQVLETTRAALGVVRITLAAAAGASPGDSPATLAALEQARTNLAAAQADLASAQGERDAARAARQAAEGERDAAQAAGAAARTERDEAEAAQREAEGQRDEAQAARAAAEGERDTAQADLANRRTLTLPDGLTAEDAGDPGEFTVEAGGTETRGGVEFRCPEDGEACRVRVFDNGEIAWWGGAPTAWPSPARSALYADLVPLERRVNVAAPTTLTIRRVGRVERDDDGDVVLNADNRAVANPDGLFADEEGNFAAPAAVAYTDGKTVTRPTGELPLRAVTMRANTQSLTSGTGRAAVQQGGSFDGLEASTGDDSTQWRNWHANVVSSIQLREDGGVVLKVGGRAGEGLIQGDMNIVPDVSSSAGPDGKRGDASASAAGTMSPDHVYDLFGAGGPPAGTSTTLTSEQATQLQGWAADNCDATDDDAGYCYDINQNDLEITFGKSSGDPARGPAAYWSARVPFEDPDNAVELGPPAASDRDYHDFGRYDLYLSKYAGLDTGDDPDSTADDTHRYLEHAAYGLFLFFDNRLGRPGPGRTQGFHFGFDAFRDDDGARPADVTTAIGATFEGVAMGWDLRDGSELNPRYSVDFGAANKVGPVVRLRGDVTLNACIGGSGANACTGTRTAANTISGEITNLDFYVPDQDNWHRYHAGDLERVALKGTTAGQDAAPIRADGSFQGTAQAFPDSRWSPQGNPDVDISDYLEFGEYSGALYGPRGAGMEAAGWWRVTPDPRDAPSGTTRSLGLVGSFGAKCTEGCAPSN